MRYTDLQYELDKRNKIKRELKKKRKPLFSFWVSNFEFKKLAIFFLLVFLLVVSGVAWYAYGRLPHLVEKKIKSWVLGSQGRNFEIQSFNYGSMKVSFDRITFSQASARLKVRYEAPYFQPRYVQILVPLLQVYFRMTPSGFQIGLSCYGAKAIGGDLLPGISPQSRRLESISDISIQAWIPAGRSPKSWKPAALNWAKKLKSWALDGARMANLNMSGNAFFLADGKLIRVYFSSSEELNGSTYLEGNADDLSEIAYVIEPKFTGEDVRIASKYFLKTPRLLHVRTLAETKAESLYQYGSKISYDTFRHIFWSYYLTQIFGSDFAHRVSEAHEAEGSGNTALESEKDRRNNALGIEYAERKLSEQDVEKMILQDPRVLENQID